MKEFGLVATQLFQTDTFSFLGNVSILRRKKKLIADKSGKGHSESRDSTQPSDPAGVYSDIK